MSLTRIITFASLLHILKETSARGRDIVALLCRGSDIKGNLSSANYRPISLTCVLCKVFEHIIAFNLTKHSANSNILFELQYGFREERS